MSARNPPLVVLHIPHRSKVIPSLSPFCLKLETFLRMANVPYQISYGMKRSKKGKLPWIEVNGEQIDDSNFCVKHLENLFTVHLDSHLNSQELAISYAFWKMLEENTYWVILYDRWVSNYTTFKSEFLQDSYPSILRSLAPAVLQKNYKKQLFAQGMGRHHPEEVYTIGRKDLMALSEFLDDKTFMMGDKPCTLDAVAFAVIAVILYSLPNSELQAYLASRDNLVLYCKRMKEKYWSDWDEEIIGQIKS
ncbi:uncharacterized protein TRIADDRAFT_28248 [Trichoplax adhaerens]|uniref:GST C-terminal domain-containing protein n=1 Tax=Trichoplax adhaerens TaxID=10228 RepID=B3S3F6_TRIAD|nr:hypothetical protein TRIADDRAFT_28248 [Trichoplax adhaerens]EDV22784.1 hypothetical protein TRIADDRAFT_28248 [Trichoplax adhaerens]|eukprot:XP_002114650.1 hypothetical protein TRIADDRAFT_28248 [Trichoplax adhaerens]